MKALLDENLSRGLVGLSAPEIDAVTVQQQGWAGRRNGDLLAAAAAFDLFLTTDRGIPHQQNLDACDTAVVLLAAPTNRLEDLAPLVEPLKASLHSVRPGLVLRITA